MRGFWEDTWLSRHAANADLKLSDRYVRTRALETHCMTDADLVVTLGEAMREEIIARGVPADNVIIVPNGVSEEFLRPLPDGAALRASLGIAPGEHVVGLVSSLVAHEGIGTLLEAVKILNDRGVRTRALIVGDGPERTALQRQAADLGLDAIFTGRVPPRPGPRLPRRPRRVRRPAHPGPGLPAGHPAQAGRGDGQRPARRGQRGQRAQRDRQRPARPACCSPRLTPARSPDQLQQLLDSPELRRKLGASAREWVARDRTWAHNAIRYREAYQRLGATRRLRTRLSAAAWPAPATMGGHRSEEAVA